MHNIARMAKAAQWPKAILDYVNIVRNIRIFNYPIREFDYFSLIKLIFPPLSMVITIDLYEF